MYYIAETPATKVPASLCRELIFVACEKNRIWMGIIGCGEVFDYDSIPIT